MVMRVQEASVQNVQTDAASATSPSRPSDVQTEVGVGALPMALGGLAPGMMSALPPILAFIASGRP
jgi:hypothetical protein